MLTKQVCIKCARAHWPKLYKIYLNAKRPWTKLDAARWKYDNNVICPCDLPGNDFPAAIVTEPPPKWCMYRLEHAVAAGMKK